MDSLTIPGVSRKVYVKRMTDMARSRIHIEWPNGGPGVNTFYWTSGYPAGAITEETVSDFHDELDAWILGLVGIYPTDASLVVEREVAIITPETGNITNVLVDPTVREAENGTGVATGSSRATQLVANLLTADFTAGKRLRGRHFIGPVSPNAIEAGGYTLTAMMTGIPDTYQAIISGVGGRLAVWHRPTGPSASDGRYADVTGVTVKPTPGILRSRRD